MSKKNPQNNDFIKSKKCANWQYICELTLFVLTLIQLFNPSKILLVIASIILIAEYILSYCAGHFFDTGHRIREMGLIDNSFGEKRIPTYNSENYYNNGTITVKEIKLLANIHENALFTSRIVGEMIPLRFLLLVFIILLTIVKIFISGLDNYASILLSFIVSSSFLDRVIRLYSLRKSSQEVYDKANEICNIYGKTSPELSELLLPKIVEILLIYENAVFDTKIVLSEKIFHKLNSSLSKEWLNIKNNYSIYSEQKEVEK